MATNNLEQYKKVHKEWSEMPNKEKFEIIRRPYDGYFMIQEKNQPHHLDKSSESYWCS